MGNYCSREDSNATRKDKKKEKKSPTSSEAGKETNKNRRASKYAVSGEDATNDTTSSQEGINTSVDGEFSGIGGDASAPSTTPDALKATPKPAPTVFAPNPALIKAPSYKVIPSVANAIIKTNSRNPSDYEANDLVNETWLRVPGEINDQRINIANCKGCTFLLMDQCDSIQIDDCEDCKFYIGPTAGSVFIRSSKNCTVVAACGQLRTRDVFDTKMALFCHSRPVIESSRNVGIGCFPSTGAYAQLLHHMCKSRLSQFTNLYFFVHDFTPSKRAGDLNYYLIPPGDVEGNTDFFPPISSLLPEVLSPDAERAMFESETIIPYVACATDMTNAIGNSLPNAGVILFAPGAIDAARAFMNRIEQRRRTEGDAKWQFLVEHQFKAQPDGASAGSMAKLGIPNSTVSALNGTDFVLGTYSCADGVDVVAMLPGGKGNVLYHGVIEPALLPSVCAHLFSDLPTQGKGFGASH